MKIKQSLIVFCGLLAVIYFSVSPFYLEKKVEVDKSLIAESIDSSGTIITKKPQKVLAPMNKKAECNTLLDDFTPTINWQNSRKYSIKQFLLKLDEQGVSKPLLDAILSHSGIGSFEGYRLLAKHERAERVDLYPLFPNELVFLFAAEQEKFLSQISSTDLQTLLSTNTKENLPKAQWLYDKKHKAVISPIAMVMKVLRNTLSPTDLYIFIEHLIRMNVQVHLTDMVHATLYGMPDNMLSLLQQHSAEEINRPFFYEEQLYTLVTFAVFHNNVNASYYWLSEGIKAQTLPFADNALDILTQQYIKGTTADKVTMFSSLMEYNVIPNNIKTYGKLLTWLPEKLRMKHEKSLTIFNFDTFSEKSLKYIGDAIGELTSIMINSEVNNPLYNKVNAACYIETTIALIPLVFNDLNIHSNRSNEHAIDNKKYVSKDTLRLNELVAQQLSNEEIMAQLGAHKDKEAKLAVSVYQHALDTQDNKYRLITEEDSENIESLGFQLLAAISEGNITESLSLLAQGAPMEPSLLLLAISTTDLSVIKAMYNRGEDIHFSRESRKNAVSIASHLNKVEMLTFFLNKGVTVKPMEFGYDPLDIALMELVIAPSNLEIVNLLINANAPIEMSHKEIVQDYQLTHPKIYSLLTQKHPQLIL